MSLKVEVHHLFSCFGKTQKFATVRLFLVYYNYYGMLGVSMHVW